MPVKTHQKQERRAAAAERRDPLGRFPKGVSGNPAGRPIGARNAATQLAEAVLDGEAEALARAVLDRAFDGDSAMLKLAFERIVPRRARTPGFALPEIRSAADLAPALAAIARAASEGTITPFDAAELARLVETALRALELGDIETRLAALERRADGSATDESEMDESTMDEADDPAI